MNISPQGLQLIREFESCRTSAYLDAVGVPTIGYGTTIIDGQAVSIGMTCTMDQAEQYLQIDIEKIEDQIGNAVTVPVEQAQFDALCDFVYNLGIGNLLRSTLLKVINGLTQGNIQVEFLRWNRAGGAVLKGLTRRRVAEAALWGPLSVDQLVSMYSLVI